jgi:hypothetical protein
MVAAARLGRAVRAGRMARAATDLVVRVPAAPYPVGRWGQVVRTDLAVRAGPVARTAPEARVDPADQRVPEGRAVRADQARDATPGAPRRPSAS